ncbi:hypothetical protein [Labilibacter marinus]|uniref:hypothetical protein n=1 Tax=Labilibacter marinus TaxID=1477105 RepID=UPI0013011518|nr:hypothetical protein [Labilibacter marinus]
MVGKGNVAQIHTLSLIVRTLATVNYRLEVRNEIWKSKTIRVVLTSTVFTAISVMY